MFRRLGQRLKKLFQWLFGLLRKQKPPDKPQPPAIKPLSDGGYEMIFLRLLDEIGEDWEEAQVWEYLGNRIYDQDFKWWLRRFGRDKLLASPVPHHELATRMVRLGEMGCGEISAIARVIGVQLLARESQPLTEEEYETLFRLLLSRVDGGQAQVLEFLEDLEYRATREQWMQWLRGYGEKLLATDFVTDLADGLSVNTTDKTLALQMVRLGEIGCGELGEVAGEIGRGLAAVDVRDVADGLSVGETDNLSVSSVRREIRMGEFISSVGDFNSQEPQEEEAIALDDVAVMLRENPSLVEELAEELQIQTTDPEVIINVLEADSWVKQGVQEYMEGDLVGALSCFDRAIAIKNDYHIAWCGRGDLLQELGRYKEAVSSYDRALAIKPDYQDALTNREEAIAALRAEC